MSSVALIAIAALAVTLVTVIVASARRRRASAPTPVRVAPGAYIPAEPDDAPLPVLPTHRNAQTSEDVRATQVPEHLSAPILPPAERRARFVRDAGRDGDRVA